MPQNISTAVKVETAVLVGVITRDVTPEQVDDYLGELAFLAKTAGIETRKMFTQKLEYPDTRTFLGKGKIEVVKEYVKENEIDIVIFDDDLSPSQMRNIEKFFE